MGNKYQQNSFFGTSNPDHISSGDVETIKRNRQTEYSSFPSNRGIKFSEGYNLVGLEWIWDYQPFFEEKGIHYVAGLIRRFSKKTTSLDEGGFLEKLIFLTGLSKNARALKEAKKFKKNHSA